MTTKAGTSNRGPPFDFLIGEGLQTDRNGSEETAGLNASPSELLFPYSITSTKESQMHTSRVYILQGFENSLLAQNPPLGPKLPFIV